MSKRPDARHQYFLVVSSSHMNALISLHLDNGTLGIEVTELCREEPRAEAARLAKIPEKAKALYGRMAGSEPIDVRLAFSRRATDLTFKQLTNSLVEFVYAHRKSRRICPPNNLPEGYCHVGIHAPFEQIDPTGRWHCVRAFDTVIAPKQLVESGIAEKNTRLVEYRLAATEVWLLIINDQFLVLEKFGCVPTTWPSGNSILTLKKCCCLRVNPAVGEKSVSFNECWNKSRDVGL